MKCTGCEKHEAIWVLIDYDNIQLLCNNCIQEISTIEGEINLDFYSIPMGWAPIIEHINRNLKYLDEQYSSLLKEYSKHKKKLDSIRNYLNKLEETGRFIDKKKIRQLLEAEG